MSAKTGIIEQSGESALLLPEIIMGAIAANDRLKYYLALLHAARAHASDRSRQSRPDLRVERQASGVPDTWLDQVVEGSTHLGGGDLVRIPGAGSIIERLFD